MWRGWTHAADADAPEQFLLDELFPAMRRGGPGFAASLVCERFDRGNVLLIDQSAAIERTRHRDQDHVASGRVALETVDVADFDPGKAHPEAARAAQLVAAPLRPGVDERTVRRSADVLHTRTSPASGATRGLSDYRERR